MQGGFARRFFMATGNGGHEKAQDRYYPCRDPRARCAPYAVYTEPRRAGIARAGIRMRDAYHTRDVMQLTDYNTAEFHRDPRPRRAPLAAGIRAGLAGLLVGLAPAPAVLADGLPVVLRDQTGAVVRFDGANLPGQPFANAFGGRSLRIEQTADRATLHWESFDISRDNEVIFDQPGSSSIALNRVLGAADLPSLIDGRLTANGRVFIVNQNGVMFGPNARVDTRSLVASSLDIDDRLFEQIGFENAINEEGRPAAFAAAPGATPGDVQVQAGAIIRSARNGRVLLIAPNVTNAGRIESPEGQIILAAAEDEVFIAPANDSDPLRGLVVGLRTGGEATNLGELISERGNISLLGLAVNQQGLARATTSVSLNGSVRLVAQDMGGQPAFTGSEENGFRPQASRAGSVTLGTGSVTEVLPDADTATAPDTQAQAASLIEMEGERIVFASGSRTTATGGEVRARANATPRLPSFDTAADPDGTAASIRVEDGAVIDVSGDTSTEVSVARNLIKVTARGNELADAPQQRGGALQDQTLFFDVREGAGFLNVDTSAAIQRDVRERLSAGGTIELQSRGRIEVEAGARLDISGGEVTNTGATLNPSQLVTRDGRVVDIAKADPDLDYAGVLGELQIEHEKWGVTETFRTARGRFEPGFVEGRDAGTLSLTAPGMRFDGDLVARTTVGRNQRLRPEDLGGDRLRAVSRAFDQRPQGGELVLKQLNINLQDLVIGSDSALPAPGDHPASRAAAFVLDPALLSGSGVSRVDIENAGRIILNRELALPAFGELELLGTQVQVAADIRAPGGRVAMEALNSGLSEAGLGSLGNLAQQLPDARSSLVRVDGEIDVSGRWINDSAAVTPQPATAAVVTEGGEILLRSARDLLLGAGSRLNVDGGARLRSDGRFETGRGGDIRLQSWTSGDIAFTSRLALEGGLSGFGPGGGGRLEVEAGQIRIDAAPADGDTGFALDGSRQFALASTGTGIQPTLTVAADTFRRGGFQAFDFTARRGGLEVAPGTDIRLQAATPVLDPAAALRLAATAPSLAVETGNGSPFERLPSADSLAAFTTPDLLPAFQRRAVDLSLASGELGPLQLGTGSRITAEPGAAIALSSASNILIDGTVSAPAGRIDVLLDGSGGQAGIQDRIRLGPQARLLAEGAVRIDPFNNLGKRVGEVLDAGRIGVQARQGSLIAAPGSRISVDAVSAVLDLGPDGLQGRREIGGAAGSIELAAAEALLPAGELSGRGVGNQPAGRLSLRLDPNTRGAASPDPTVPDPFHRGETVARIGAFTGSIPGAADPVPDSLIGTAQVPLDQVRSGGFDTLEVTVRASAVTAGTPDQPDSVPVIEFAEALDLTLARRIALDAPVLRVGNAATVALTAPQVALGSTDSRGRLDGARTAVRFDATGNPISNPDTDPNALRLDLQPSGGDGRLQVNGELIELAGELVTQGVGQPGTAGLVLNAARDIRLRGVRVQNRNDFTGLLRSAGGLELIAARVFPTTLSEFELSVTGAGGRLDIRRPAAVDTRIPLSLDGSVRLRADLIRQGGSLFAPLGTLDLQAATRLSLAAGSLTSTSATGVEAPFFRTQTGGALAFNDEGGILFVADPDESFERALPEQRLRLAGADVQVDAGAQFDLRGGSQARALQFQPGTGGTRDILLADLDPSEGVSPNPAFAIVPAAGEFAPFDPLETPLSQSIQGFELGDTLVLEEGMAGLPPGEYAILPPRYALFGGFLVTPVAGSQDLTAGLGRARSDGAPILSGRFGVAGSDAAAARSQGFAIEDGARVRARAEFAETPLETFFADSGLSSPRDAGTLVIEPGQTLRLDGQLVQGGAGGLGSQVDIIADAIRIRDRSSGAGGIELLTAQLEGLGADSLLIGGSRRSSIEGVVIDARADTVEVADGVALDVPELILVGDRVSVGAPGGAATRLGSNREAREEQATLIVSGEGGRGDAALVAVSDRRLTLERPAPTGSAGGQLEIAADTTLAAAGSVVADVEGDADIAGEIDAPGARVSLGAASIAQGETDGRNLNAGLVLSNADLARLAGSALTLRSGSSIETFGGLFDPADGSTIAFDRLTLDARGLIGRDNAGDTLRLNAAAIRLANSTGADLAEAGLAPGAGALELTAGRLELGAGLFSVQGFGAVSVQARESLLIADSGQWRVEAPLTLDTPIIAAAAGVDSAIRARGAALTVTGGDAGAPLPAGAGLAAALRFEGSAIAYSGRAVLPSGRLTLQQTGDPANPVAGDDLVLGGGASVDVGGLSLDFGPETLDTPGGEILLLAETGSIRVDSGVELDTAAAGAEWDGTLRMEAAQGEVSLAGDLRLPAGARGGRFLLDTQRLSVGGDSGDTAFGALNRLLGTGFSVERDVRLRDQSILIAAGETLRSHSLRVASDTGDIRVAGTLDASGLGPDSAYENGGRIVLAAGDALDIESTAVLRATGSSDAAGAPAPDTRGGEIDLIALDADGDDPDGLNDRVKLAAGARLDTRGGAAAPAQDPFLVRAPETRDGAVRVHTRRLDTDTDGQTETLVAGAMDATLEGVARAELIATRRLDDAFIDAADISAWRTETEAFLQAAPATMGGFTVVPGLSVESAGDLVLATDWDFQGAASAGGWHFGQSATDPGLPGHLTLRAGNELRLQGDLSDAFFDAPPVGFTPGLPDRLDTNPFAWSFHLVAGADAAAADPQATGRSAADLVLDPAVRLRTGTGDINLAASGDVRLGAEAAVFTGGRDRGLSDNIKALDFLAVTNFNDFLGEGAIFPVGGGDVGVRAGGDILGAAAPRSPGEWQPRIGEAELLPAENSTLPGRAGAVPTHWGIAFHRFANGIGALGGGEVDIRAGGDLRSLILAIPTTGRTLDGAVKVSAFSGRFDEALEITEVAGGGLLRVALGGDLRDSLIQLGDGVADIQVAGDAGAGVLGRPLEIVSGGDTRLGLTAGGELDIARLQDFGALDISATQGLGVEDADFFGDPLFFTYTETASLDLRTLAGDLSLAGTAGDANALAPGFRAASLSGDLVLLENLVQLPGTRGQLELLAGRDIRVQTQTVQFQARQSDQDRRRLPGIQNPVNGGDGFSNLPANADVPVHLGDPRPNLIVAREGSIRTAGTGFWELNLAKSTHVQAGTDIVNVSARIQNVNPTDVTSFIAGRDIFQLTQRTSSGQFRTFAEDSDQASQFEIAGPGVAEFLAGRRIDLGTSDGIETIGNLKNRFLADTGARLIALAGLGGEPAYDTFIQAFLADGVDVGAAQGGVVDYRARLGDFLAGRGITDAPDAVAAFRALDRREQRPLLVDILMSELRESGVFAETSETDDFSRGFAAIDLLFPLSNPDGGISMLLSQIQTLDGGRIDLLVPGGSIDAGAASSSTIDKAASALGVVAARSSDVNIFVDGDLRVNSTRVFALQGDLLIWSSNGNIDAGRGARTAASIPVPISRIGPNGETLIEFPPAVEGSGLQAGNDAFLFAPRGVINAGDAGIRTSGNLTLSATEVIGADNIDVGGIAVGVPVANTGVGASFAGASNVASAATNQAVESTGSIGSGGDGAQEEAAVGVLSVQVVGFGD